MSWIDKLVGKSPIRPMQEHIRVVVTCASQVTDLSGRGVGMDVVKDRVDDLRGHIRIESIPGRAPASRSLCR